MGNTTSERRKAERISNKRFNLNEITPEQKAFVLGLQQELENAESKIEAQNQIVRVKSTIIDQLTQKNTELQEIQRANNERLRWNENSQEQEDTILQLQKLFERASSDRVVLNEITRKQQATILQLQQKLKTAESKIEAQNQSIGEQSTKIQQLTKENNELQEFRRREVWKQTCKITRETQTDQDVDNHSAILHRIPSIGSSNHSMVFHRTPSIASSNVEYHHHETDSLLEVRIERPRNAEPPGKPNFRVLQILNASNQIWSHDLNVAMQTYIPRLGAGEKLYYHGSSDRNVKCILENGIDVTKSFRATDFSCGNGFYVTKDFGKAVDWSKRVAGWKKGRPAIIAFRISRRLRKEEPHLALKVDTTTNRKWWECVVSHCRHSAQSTDVGNVLKNVKFIKGPVANNRYVRSNEVPRPFKFTQLCIRDEDYALRFGSLKNIAFAIFAVDT